MEQRAARKPKTGSPEAAEAGGGSDLLGTLQQRLRAEGPIPFSAFMQLALYHPEHGYYTSRAMPGGAAGDYMTAPQVHPALGRAVARLAAELDEALAFPDPFVLIEGGSGDGSLLGAVLQTIAQEAQPCWDRLRVFSVEAGPAARAQQRNRLPLPGRGLELVARIEDVAVESGAGLLYSNELFDAFTVERVRRARGRLQRAFVEAADGSLRARFMPLDDEVIRAHLESNGIVLAEGQIAELCIEAARWLRRGLACLTRGAALTIDYGHETATLYGPSRPHGTLVAHRRFALSDDLLAHPGEQDLTAHIDFGNLRRVGRQLGWQDRELCSLRVLLLGFGVASDPVSDERARLALRHLLVGEIGDVHRALLQVRGLPPGLPCFGLERLETGNSGA